MDKKCPNYGENDKIMVETPHIMVVLLKNMEEISHFLLLNGGKLPISIQIFYKIVFT